MGGLLHLVQRGGAWAGCGHVTAHPSTASVPITVLLYDGPLLCGFNVAIKGLIQYKCRVATRYNCASSWPPLSASSRISVPY